MVLEDDSSRTVSVANDRFATIPFFYAVDGHELHGSVNYIALLTQLQAKSTIELVPEAIYEFLHFQRLLGNKTYDTRTRSMDSASVLRWDAEAATALVERYWRPDFKKDNQASVDDLAQDLARAVRGAIEKRTSDGRRYGLFLSGGLDSRLVLAGSTSPVHCFTVGEFENNEVQVAARAAAVAGSPHTFIRRPKDHYGGILHEAVQLGGGMNVFDHAHFLGLGTAVVEESDVVLHGFAIDTLFQGSFLPNRRVTYRGRPTYMKRIEDPSLDLTERYLDTVSYRLKSVDPLDIITTQQRGRMRESIRESVNAIATEAERSADEPYDIWEFVHLHNMSNGVANLNLRSIRTFAEEHTITFDASIVDIYLRTPARRRIHGSVLRRALRLLNPALANLPNSNTNLTASYGPARATTAFYTNLILRKTGIRADAPQPPTPTDRSWPNRDDLVRELPSLRTRAQAIKESDRLDALGIFSMDSVREHIDHHMEGRRRYGALLLTLLTIDTFLEIAQP